MSDNVKKEINFWPYAIVGMILTVVMVGIWTIRIAINNPVQESNDYMMKYQDVEENINELLARQKAFESRYRIDFGNHGLKYGTNVVKLKVVDKSGRPVDDAKIYAIVTRPTTSKYDKKLDSFRYENGYYVSQPFEIKREGRWNIQVKVTVGSDVGFKTYKTFVQKEAG